MNEPANIQHLREAITRIKDHMKYARRDSHDLPAEISHTVELLCVAAENLLEVQRRKFSYVPAKDPQFEESVRADITAEAVHQIEEALREIKIHAEDISAPPL